MKNFLPALVLLIWCLKGWTQTGFSLSGTMPATDTGWVYLQYENDDGPFTDSSWLREGRFLFSGSVPHALVATLQYNVKIHNGQRYVNVFDVFLDNTAMTLRARKDTVGHYHFHVTGSAFHKAYDSLKLISGDAMDLAVYDRYIDHNSNILSAWLIDYIYSYNPDYVKIKKWFDRFDRLILASATGQRVAELLEISARVAIGQSAPAFTAYDSSGQAIPLVNFRGKSVLLVFWASWCGPCRQEMQALKPIYSQLDKSKVEIVCLSVDQSQQAWVRACLEENIPWTQLIARPVPGNDPAADYGITGLPINFLLDPSGNIIGKNLYGHALLTALGASTAK